MMYFQFAKQRHEELLREAEMNRQVNWYTPVRNRQTSSLAEAKMA